ncbi:MAG: RagB/SusD family nutrient uptake outer membrane protein, partial [Bacteroidota bacterium]
MKKNIITFISIVTFSFLLNSCNNDLTEELKGSLSEATLTTEKDAFALIDGCYHTLIGGGWDYYARDWNWVHDGSTDVWMGNAPETGRLQMKWNENEALNVWTHAFRLVGRTNTAIDLIEKMDDAEFEDVTIKKRLFAEALFLRCLAYTDLTGLFGDVPLLLEPIKDAGFLPARDPVATVYAQIEADLAVAIEDLPITYDVEIGRATKGAA